MSIVVPVLDDVKYPCTATIINYEFFAIENDNYYYRLEIAYDLESCDRFIKCGWPFLLENNPVDNWLFIDQIYSKGNTLGRASIIVVSSKILSIKHYSQIIFLNQFDYGISNEDIYEYTKNVFQ